MGKRPTPHVDTSANTGISEGFAPNMSPATMGTKHVKGTLFGDNGTGKTYTIGTFPKPIILALDPGYSVLTQLPNAADIMVARIPDPERPKVGRLRQLWDWLLWLEAGDHDRETAGLDSITELHKIILAAVMTKPRQRPAPGVPDTDDYVEANEKLRTIIRFARDLPMHVVFTAHHKMIKKKDDLVGIRPDLSEKLSTELGGACDFVMHTSVHEIEGEDGQRLIAYLGQTVPVNGAEYVPVADTIWSSVSAWSRPDTLVVSRIV